MKTRSVFAVVCIGAVSTGVFLLAANSALAQSSSRGVPSAQPIIRQGNVISQGSSNRAPIVQQGRAVYGAVPANQGSSSRSAAPVVSNQGSSSRQTTSVMSSAVPTIGLEGYCPVCIIEMNKWVKGDAQFKTAYDGKTYFFPGDKQLQMFLADPAKYTPAAGGDCVVCLANMKKRAPGNIRHSAMLLKRLYLFPNEELKQEFVANPKKYYRAADALGGHCAVCQVEMNQMVRGKEEINAFKNGIRYLFPSDKQRSMFLANPEKYSVTK